MQKKLSNIHFSLLLISFRKHTVGKNSFIFLISDESAAIIKEVSENTQKLYSHKFSTTERYSDKTIFNIIACVGTKIGRRVVLSIDAYNVDDINSISQMNERRYRCEIVCVKDEVH